MRSIQCEIIRYVTRSYARRDLIRILSPRSLPRIIFSFAICIHPAKVRPVSDQALETEALPHGRSQGILSGNTDCTGVALPQVDLYRDAKTFGPGPHPRVHLHLFIPNGGL